MLHGRKGQSGFHCHPVVENRLMVFADIFEAVGGGRNDSFQRDRLRGDNSSMGHWRNSLLMECNFFYSERLGVFNDHCKGGREWKR